LVAFSSTPEKCATSLPVAMSTRTVAAPAFRLAAMFVWGTSDAASMRSSK
jgi:hypothetical protein